MPNNDLFSGIPALDDQEGLENLINQQALDSMGVSAQQPTALEQNVSNPQQQTTEPAQQQQQAGTQIPYTSEQIAQIVARNQQLEAYALQQQQQQSATQPSQQQRQAQPLYNERQIQIINELLNRGVSIDRIADALNKNRKNTVVQNETAQRLQQIEQYLQQQEYNRAYSEFEQKMFNFGNKFGLSEDDLVAFGNKADSMGIDVTRVTDLEPVFRALYPEQYALRSQRISNNNTSQIYGGVSVGETPRASANKIEDAYVDAFMKQTMPNQYNLFKK